MVEMWGLLWDDPESADVKAPTPAPEVTLNSSGQETQLQAYASLKRLKANLQQRKMRYQAPSRFKMGITKEKRKRLQAYPFPQRHTTSLPAQIAAKLTLKLARVASYHERLQRKLIFMKALAARKA
jgi:hypothetical protein